MKKVLIVDDEILSIEYLKSLSSWEKYGCTGIDSAWIASKALECFRREHHPVVFVDIRMPGMDGLALSRELLRICPDTIIVIMTAWQEFEYVKEAMQIGVKFFLVKHEITEEKLDELLAQISAHIDLQKNYKNALWNGWLRNLWEDGGRSEGPGKGKNPYFLVLITLRGLSMFLEDTREEYISEKQIRSLQVPGVLVKAFSRLEGFTYGVLCEYGPSYSKMNQQRDMTVFLAGLEDVCQKSGDLKPVFYLSGLKNSAMDFFGLCMELKRFSHGILWIRKDVVREEELAEYEELERSFFSGKIPEEWDQNDLRMLLEKGGRRKFLVRMTDLSSVRMFLLNRIDADYLKEQDECVRIVSLEQLLRVSLRFLENGGLQKGRIVKQAVDYIRAHYSEDISSSLIAEELHVSDGYLRAMFKKEFSCTIKEYILQYRIDRAKELLRQDGKKVYEIAAGCGFASSQHFCRVFHQVTGMTPGEYKQK